MYRLWLLTKIKAKLILQKPYILLFFGLVMIALFLMMPQMKATSIKIGISQTGDEAVIRALTALNSDILELHSLTKEEALQLLEQRRIELYLDIYEAKESAGTAQSPLFESYYLKGNLVAKFIIDRLSAWLLAIPYTQELTKSLQHLIELGYQTGESSIPALQTEIILEIVGNAEFLKKEFKQGKYFKIEELSEDAGKESRPNLSILSILMVFLGIYWILLSYFALKLLSIHHKNVRIKIVGFNNIHQCLSTLLLFSIPTACVNLPVLLLAKTNELHDFYSIFSLGQGIAILLLILLIGWTADKKLFLMYSFLGYLLMIGLGISYFVL